MKSTILDTQDMFLIVLWYFGCAGCSVLGPCGLTKLCENKLSQNANRCQFHQHLRSHFCMKFWRQSQNITRKAVKKDVCTKKACEKTLMKLTAGQLSEKPK